MKWLALNCRAKACRGRSSFVLPGEGAEVHCEHGRDLCHFRDSTRWMCKMVFPSITDVTKTFCFEVCKNVGKGKQWLTRRLPQVVCCTDYRRIARHDRSSTNSFLPSAVKWKDEFKVCHSELMATVWRWNTAQCLCVYGYVYAHVVFIMTSGC